MTHILPAFASLLAESVVVAPVVADARRERKGQAEQTMMRRTK